jgi:hypothetical protein
MRRPHTFTIIKVLHYGEPGLAMRSEKALASSEVSKRMFSPQQTKSPSPPSSTRTTFPHVSHL